MTLIDFEFARSVSTPQFNSTDSDDDESFRLTGTLPYVAPETLTVGDRSTKSDVFSAGIMIFEVVM